MALHKALKPFGWYPNGYEREALVEGDVRDFGDVAEGLVDAKMIEPVEALEVKAEEPMPVEVPETDDEPPADWDGALNGSTDTEESNQPKRRGRSHR